MYLTTRYPQINPVLVGNSMCEYREMVSRYGMPGYVYAYMCVYILQGVEDEHFIVWMRTAALPNFRKLYAKINTDLEAGSVLAIDVDGNFEVNSFGGKKYLGKWRSVSPFSPLVASDPYVVCHVMLPQSSPPCPGSVARMTSWGSRILWWAPSAWH